jgi:hypothetical protein
MTGVPRATPKRNDTRTYSAWEWARAYVALAFQAPFWIIVASYCAITGRIPDWFRRKLLRDHDVYTRQPMDFRIPPNTDTPAYMLRWWRIPRNAYFNIYYHIVLRGDDDRALHDHPWMNVSLILEGGYFEHTIDEGGINRKVWYPAGSVRFRRAGTFAHRLELKTEPLLDTPLRHIEDLDAVNVDWQANTIEMPVKTIFITGPVLRRWGFHHPDQWVDAYDWDAFLAARGVANTMPMDGGSDGAVSARNKL